MSKTFRFNLPDIHCSSCTQPVENALKDKDKLANHPWLEMEFSIDVSTQIITITVDDNSHTDEEICEILINIIKGVGVKCTLNDQDELNAIAEQDKNFRSHLIKGVIGVVVGLGLMILELVGVVFPPIAMYIIMGGSALLTFILGAESYYHGIVSLIKTQTLTMDILFTISTLTVIGISIASIFLPGIFPMMMETGLLIFGFYHIGNAVKASIREKITKGLLFQNCAVQKVQKRIQEDPPLWEECEVKDLNIGDIIQVKGGETIPVDGVCRSNGAFVFNKRETGNITPVKVQHGGKIFSGMEVWEGIEFIELKVEEVENTYLTRLDKSIARINQEKPPEKSSIEITTSKILQYFVPTVVVLALIAGLTIGIVFTPGLGLLCAAVILVSVCPCMLGLVTPLAIKMEMVKALENDVEFKSSGKLEDASNIDVVVFDLTGTLTTGVPVITHGILKTDPSEKDEQEFFAYLSEIEKGVKHPKASAIYEYAKLKLTSDSSFKVSERDLSFHSGVKTTVGGVEYLIGNRDFLSHHDIKIPHRTIEDSQTDKHYLVRNGVVVGWVNIEYPLREDAKFTIDELRGMGKEVHICTGSEQGYAEMVGIKLGIPKENIAGGRVSEPTDPNAPNALTKTAYIKQLKEKQKKRVAMVGDNDNDAPAIAESNFSIVVNSGEKIAKDEAGALIYKDSLLPVVTALAIAEETIWSVKQNLVINLVFNMTVILMGCGILVVFVLNPGIGVALMVLQVALVLLNQYRIKCQELDHLKRYRDEQASKAEDNPDQSTYQSGLEQKPVIQLPNQLGKAQSQPPMYPVVLSVEKPIISLSDTEPTAPNLNAKLLESH